MLGATRLRDYGGGKIAGFVRVRGLKRIRVELGDYDSKLRPVRARELKRAGRGKKRKIPYAREVKKLEKTNLTHGRGYGSGIG